MALAANLKRLRQQAGLSQVQLADMIGVAHTRVSEIERGQGNPTLATIEALAKALETTVERLVRVPKNLREPV